jgi:SH3-like domain-containing protein
MSEKGMCRAGREKPFHRLSLQRVMMSEFRLQQTARMGGKSCKRLTNRMSCILAVAIAWIFFAPVAAIAQAQVGQSTGLPLPRYVSLKSDRVNLREGPSKDHRTSWVFQRAGLPVEITAEFENWRRIRDSEGTEGWVLQSLLSGRRTALVAPWRRGEVFPIFAKPVDDAPVAAKLQSGVQGNIRKCDGSWCRISGDGYEGFVQQSLLWGVYPGDKFD